MKAADPVGSAACWGSRPAFLDRLPSWIRTRHTTACNGDAVHVLVVRDGDWLPSGHGLPRGGRLGEQPRHRLPRGCGHTAAPSAWHSIGEQAGARHGSNGPATANGQCATRNGCVLHCGHLLPISVRDRRRDAKAAYGDTGRWATQFLASRSPADRSPPPADRPRRPIAPTRPLAPGEHFKIVARFWGIYSLWDDNDLGRDRIKPSCTTDTTRSPSAVKTSPRASPRAPPAAGDSCE
jgi:hypothetical protein